MLRPEGASPPGPCVQSLGGPGDPGPRGPDTAGTRAVEVLQGPQGWPQAGRHGPPLGGEHSGSIWGPWS